MPENSTARAAHRRPTAVGTNACSDTGRNGRTREERRPILDPAATVVATSPDRVVVWRFGHTVGFRAGENRAAATVSFLTDLTGALTLEEVARIHGLEAGLAERIVSALHGQDLVRWASDLHGGGGDGAPANGSQRGRSALQAWDLPERLSEITVTLLGWDDMLEAIAGQLGELGVGRIAVVAAEEAPEAWVGSPGALDPNTRGEPQPTGSALGITSWDEIGAAVADPDARCRASAVPLLPCGWSGTLAIVGPLLSATSAVCFDCFWQRRLSHMAPSSDRDAFVAAWRRGLVQPLKPPVHAPHLALIAAMATLEAMRVLNGHDSPTAQGLALCLDVERMALTHERVLALPNCRRCRPADALSGTMS
jgi:bacteriocin biosynthesis cyclodehydratase domain-containing protein